MTQDEIIEMPPYLNASYEGDDLYTGDQVRELMKLVAAKEREACAKVCDAKVNAEYATGKVDHNEMGWTQSCAISIRARGEQA